MIYGFYLLTAIGTPILEEEFLEISTKERKPMFASTMSAIADLIETTVKEKMTYVEIEGAYVYISSGEKFITILLADEENIEYGKLASKILNILEEKYSPDDLLKSPKLKEEAKNIFKIEILKAVPIIPSIRKMLKVMEDNIHFVSDKLASELNRELKTEKKILDISAGKKISPFLVSTFNFDDILTNIIQCNLTQAFVDFYLNLSSLNVDQIGLLAWIGIALNRFAVKKPAPELSVIHEIIGKVNNEALRQYLKSLIDSFNNIEAFNQRFQIRVSNIKSKALCIALIDSNNEEVRKCIKYHRLDDSTLIKGMLSVLEVITEPFRKFDDINSWLIFIGEKRLELERSKSCIEFAFLQYIFGILRVFEISTINLEIIRSFIDELEAKVKILNKIDPDSVYSHAYWLSKSIYYNYVKFLAGLIPKETKAKNANIKGKIKQMIREINSLRRLYTCNRIEKAIYLVTLSNVMLEFFRLYSALGYIPKEAIEILNGLIEEKMEDIKNFAPSLFIMYSSALLEILGFIADLLTDKPLKRSIFQRIGYLLEKLALENEKIHYINLILNLMALVYYLKSSNKYSVESAKDISRRIIDKYLGLSPMLEKFIQHL